MSDEKHSSRVVVLQRPKMNKNKPYKKNNNPRGPIRLAAPTLRPWNTASQPPPIRSLIRFDNKPYWTVQSGEIKSVLTTGAGVTTYQKNFTSTDIPGFGAGLAGSFDQYWIRTVEFWLTPQATNLSTTGISVVIDYDDSAALSLAAIQQYSNVCSAVTNCGIHGIFHPHVAVAAYGGAFTQFKNEQSSWIDSGSTTVQHYGIKVVADINAAAIIYDLRYRLEVGFRNNI